MIRTRRHRDLPLRFLLVLGGVLASTAAGAAGAVTGGSFNVEIVAIDGRGHETNLTRDPATDVAPAVAHDGRIVFVSTRDGSGDLYVMNSAGGAVRRLTTNSGVSGSLDTLDFSKAAWSPAADSIAFDGLYTAVSNCLQHCASWNVLTVDPDGRHLEQVALDARAPAWSPNGQRLAYESGVDSYFTAHGITIARPDGSDAVQLRLLNRDSSVGPVWSPSGREVAFQGRSTDVAADSIYTARADGHHMRRLAAGHDPAWSPDGHRLAYISGYTLLTIETDGTGKRHLSRKGEYVIKAAWAPNGRTIAYIAGTNLGRYGGSPTNLRVQTVTADGKRPRVLRRESPSSLIYGDPIWAPDGGRIIIAVDRR